MDGDYHRPRYKAAYRRLLGLSYTDGQWAYIEPYEATIVALVSYLCRRLHRLWRLHAALVVIAGMNQF